MKTEAIKGCAIELIPGNAFSIETPEQLLKAHQNMIFVGKRGSGKSVAATNYIKMMKFDRIFVISSTFDSNKKLMEALKIEEDDVYDPDDAIHAIQSIIAKCEGERDDYVRYHELLKKHKRFKKLIKNINYPIESIPEDLLESLNDIIHMPKHKYNGRKPVMALFVDDAQSTALFRTPKFLNMVTRHRHIAPLPEGGALGLSLFICVQNWTSQYGGTPRTVKNNATALCIFKVQDQKELEQVYEGVAGEITREEFDQAYEYAISEPHSFMMIDFHPKKHHSMFRKRFDEFIWFGKDEKNNVQ
jgi:hypothetical protein